MHINKLVFKNISRKFCSINISIVKKNRGLVWGHFLGMTKLEYPLTELKFFVKFTVKVLRIWIYLKKFPQKHNFLMNKHFMHELRNKNFKDGLPPRKAKEISNFIIKLGSICLFLRKWSIEKKNIRFHKSHRTLYIW